MRHSFSTYGLKKKKTLDISIRHLFFNWRKHQNKTVEKKTVQHFPTHQKIYLAHFPLFRSLSSLRRLHYPCPFSPFDLISTNCHNKQERRHTYNLKVECNQLQSSLNLLPLGSSSCLTSARDDRLIFYKLSY